MRSTISRSRATAGAYSWGKPTIPMRPPAFRPALLKRQPVCIKLIENLPSHANQPEPMTAKRMKRPEAVLPFDPSVANGVSRPRTLDHRAASGGVGSWGGGAYTQGRDSLIGFWSVGRDPDLMSRWRSSRMLFVGACEFTRPSEAVERQKPRPRDSEVA
jgi:hypothetical protein